MLALTDLRKDDSIIITKPDKGNGVVIVNKLDYLNKMKLLVSDETKFKKLTQNPTKSREDSLISYLRKLRKDDAAFHKILSCGSTPGVRYGLPKVHKPGCPFRPIVSSVNTYNYNLASYLDVYKTWTGVHGPPHGPGPWTTMDHPMDLVHGYLDRPIFIHDRV